MSREKELAKNTGILMIGTFLPKLASFVVLPILTGYLTKDEYGTYDLITILVSLLLCSVTLQIQTAAFRFMVDARDDDHALRSIISTILAFVIPISLVTLTILYVVLGDIDPMVRVFICLYLFTDIVAHVLRQCVRGFGKNHLYTVASFINAVFQLVLTFLLVANLGLGLRGAVGMLAISETATVLFLLFSSKVYRYFSFKAINLQQLKSCLKYSFPMVPNYLAMWVMRLCNRLIITLFLGVAANAVFAVAYKIPQILTLMQNSFSMAWQENASLALKDSDHSAYYTKTFNTMFRLMVGFLSMIIAATPLLFFLLIQGDYAEAYVQIPPLIVAMLFFSLSSFLGGIYVAYMKTVSVGVTTVVAAALNAGLCFALIPNIGITGATIAMLVSFFALFLFRLFDLRKYDVHIHIDAKIALIATAVVTVQIFLCWQQTLVFDALNALIAVVLFLALNRESTKVILKAIKKKLGR